MTRVARLPARRWREARMLRLEALKTDPAAFGSSYEEEVDRPEDEWVSRMKNTLFALSGEKPVGMISRVFNDRIKTAHVAAIYGFYVTPKSRGRGIGKLLFARALQDIQGNRKIIKVQLSVNPKFRAALGIYRSFGFEAAGTAKNELRVGSRYYDMLNMEKEVRRYKIGEKDL